MSTNEASREIIDQIRQYDPLRIILFGSAARNELDPYSDLDFIILKETSSPFLRRYLDIAPFLKNTIPVDIFIYTPEEFEKMKQEGNPFIEQVIQQGKIVYERPQRGSPKMAETVTT